MHNGRRQEIQRKEKKITGSNGEGDGDQKKKKSIAAHMKCRQGYQMIIQNILKKKHHRDAALCASI